MTSKLPKTKMRTASAERTSPAGYFPKARTALGITLVLLAAAVLFCGAGAAAPSGTAINDLAGLTSAASSGGTYYLAEDISGVSDLTVSSYFTLDLNGKTLTAASGKRLFTVDSGRFTLNDSVGGGELTGGSADNGGAMYVDGGEFEMNGGNITNCAAGYGGAVYLNNGPFTMTGGNITECTATEKGGGVYVKKLFTMNGGTITGCTAPNGGGVFIGDSYINLGGGKIINCKATSGNGGGVYVGEIQSYIYGTSVISGCTATGSGGAVYIEGSLQLQGGSITGCTADKGGAVYVGDKSGGRFNMTGGEINKCNATNGAYIFFNSSGTSCSITRGIFDTNALASKVSSGITVPSNNLTLIDGSNTLYQYSNTSPDTLCACPFTAPDSKIFAGWATSQGGPKVYDDKASVTISGTLYAVWEDAIVEIIETGLTYRTVAEAFTAAKSGQTVKLLKNSALTSEITVSKNLTLDLNGKTLTAADNKRLFTVSSGCTFTLTDSGTGGKLTGGSVSDNGGGVCVNGGTFKMEGGSITGCSTDGSGGGVHVNSGKFEMSGGSISGCSATTDGGGVFVEDGEFAMSGGSITGCTSSSNSSGGGGVFVLFGTFNMSGGSITGCSATNNDGGGVCVYGTFTMSAGSITGCSATNKGGGVYNSGTFTMSGGSITGCNATENGGGAYINGDSDCYVSGAAEITGNTAQGNAENLYLSNDDLLHLAGAFTGSIGVTVKDQTPAENLKFGIFDSGSGAEKFFADGAEFTGTISGTDLVWEANAVTVTFNENGGEGSMDKQAIEIDVPTKLNKNTFKRTGYTFDGWATSEEGAVAYADEEEVTLTEDLDLYAHWTVIKPKPSGGSQDTGSGNYTEYPRTADGNGGVITFGTSKNVKAVELPAGVKGEVILKTKTSEKGPEGEETLLVFEINIRNYPEGTPAGITYEFPLGEIEKTGHTPADYILMHKDSETEWSKLPTTYEVTGTKAVYTAVTTAFSPFAIVYAEGGAKPAGGDAAVVEQTAVPTVVVTAAPAAEPVKTAAPTAEPTKAAKSPAALGGLAAGLAAAGLLFGRRE